MKIEITVTSSGGKRTEVFNNTSSAHSFIDKLNKHISKSRNLFSKKDLNKKIYSVSYKNDFLCVYKDKEEYLEYENYKKTYQGKYGSTWEKQ